ncbi:hypothetical protein [Candidatus Tisiphia endosymbiont of Ceraclea dissimilis]
MTHNHNIIFFLITNPNALNFKMQTHFKSPEIIYTIVSGAV